jgi:hypothetical protein
LSLDKQDSLPLNSKKIEEDYTMFDEQIENDDQELQEIAEEPFDEEDEDSDTNEGG